MGPRLTASSLHPNIVESTEVLRPGRGRHLYVRHEYLPVLSLDDRVQRHGPLPPGGSSYLLRQVCQALRVAHAAGLIHRDISGTLESCPDRAGATTVQAGWTTVAKSGRLRPVPRAVVASSPHLTRGGGGGQVLGTPCSWLPNR